MKSERREEAGDEAVKEKNSGKKVPACHLSQRKLPKLGALYMIRIKQELFIKEQGLNHKKEWT